MKKSPRPGVRMTPTCSHFLGLLDKAICWMIVVVPLPALLPLFTPGPVEAIQHEQLAGLIEGWRGRQDGAKERIA